MWQTGIDKGGKMLQIYGKSNFTTNLFNQLLSGRNQGKTFTI